MPDSNEPRQRTLGLLGATGVGVGAIVGGGILALAGVAFATTGPGAIVAFGLNGCIAMLTALSFAALASRFPESGGTYTYARKVLAVEAAFAVGWVVWFASVVAAVLYALGFAAFLVPVLEQVIAVAGGAPPGWLGSRFAMLLYALAAVAFYTWLLMRSAAGGGRWETVGKVVVFGVVIAGGFWVMLTNPPSVEELSSRFRPFLTQGGQGLVQAMGYTFIALQGFDLIAAVGGEVKDPERNIPRAMILSLSTALVIYLPLLFLIVAMGSPDRPVAETAAANPEIMVAVAARNFLGPTGYWLVVVAGLLSMLSALQANLLAASRFARTMAGDRTLPRRFESLTPGSGTPVPAITLTAATVAFVLVAVPNVAAAGAMSSLIFLTSFALVHGIAFLARRRALTASPFQTPAFPLVQVVGGATCIALALFQSVAVPSAGALTALWLAVGGLLFITQLASRARVFDAAAEALDPQLLRLRGRSPVVLVPIANPASTETLVAMADALAPHHVARVLLLSVVRPHEGWNGRDIEQQVSDAQTILGGALTTALAAELRPEALITVSDDPWDEIIRVAGRYRCDSVLLGFGALGTDFMTGPLEALLERMAGDAVILRAPSNWSVDRVRSILVPAGGRRDQSPVRARLIGNFSRTAAREVTYLRVMPPDTDAAAERRARAELGRLARDEAAGVSTAEVILGDSVADEIAARAAGSDLLILGLQRLGRRRRVFGEQVLEIAQRTTCPLLMISRRS
ncbi:MAG TPA: amino acid permease [Chondromyces sp.]|nr:amino acid permease [Chondromyces sp.]